MCHITSQDLVAMTFFGNEIYGRYLPANAMCLVALVASEIGQP